MKDWITAKLWIQESLAKLISDFEAKFLTCRPWLWVHWVFFIRRFLSKQLTKLSREHFGLLVSQWKMGRLPSEADTRQSEGGTTSCSLPIETHTHTRTQIRLHSQYLQDYGNIFRELPAFIFFNLYYICRAFPFNKSKVKSRTRWQHLKEVQNIRQNRVIWILTSQVCDVGSHLVLKLDEQTVNPHKGAFMH